MGQLELIVFDLDFTLWDCGGLWVDCTDFPFRKDSSGRIEDGSGRHLRLFEDVGDILDVVDHMDIPMALASRTEQPAWARNLLDLMGIRSRFAFEEIYPGSKVAHFQKLKIDSGVSFENMLFFDDENRNIVEVGDLGVNSVLVPNGLNSGLFEKGFENARIRQRPFE